MPWNTVFICGNAKFCTSEGFATPFSTLSSSSDQWSSATVSIQDIGLAGPWIMIELEGGDRPAIFRAVLEGWMISCNELSTTITMQSLQPDGLMTTTEKLHFSTQRDYWMFMSFIVAGRAHEYLVRRTDGLSGPGGTSRISMY